MMKTLAAVLLALLSGCKEKPAPSASASDELPIVGVVSGLKFVEYKEPSGAFTVNAPAQWKLREDDSLGPSASLLGPGNDKFPRSVSIHISRYPNTVDKSTDIAKYHQELSLMGSNRNVSPLKSEMVAGKRVFRYSYERPFRRLHERIIRYYNREDIVEIPFDGGFYAIRHVAPVEIYKETLPVFEAVVASFKPGPVPPAK
jgi:hypothetical protein